MSMTISAAVLGEMGRPRPYAGSRPIEIRELRLDDPGPEEVRIRVSAAGVCHSDLSVVDGNRRRPVPMALGHEGAGVVEAVGAAVTDLAPGQHVTTVFLPRCGQCAHCRTDGKLPCLPGTESNNAGTLPGGHIRLHDGDTDVFHHLGASVFATHAVLHRSSVVPVGEDVPAAVAAVLGCAVLTGGGAVKNAGRPEPGQDVMIVGLGGVGMAALLTAVGLGTGKVIGVDANEGKLDRARELGAAEAYTPAQIRDRGLTAPVVIECAGHPKAFETAFEATATGGTTVTVGLPGPEAVSNIHPLTLTAQARTIVGSYLGSAVPSRDIPEYAELWRQGKLPVEELVSGRIALDGLNEAFDTLAEGRAVRQVIDF